MGSRIDDSWTFAPPPPIPPGPIPPHIAVRTDCIQQCGAQHNNYFIIDTLNLQVARRGVCKIVLGGGGHGSGFVFGNVGGYFIMTNSHVLPTYEAARGARFEFYPAAGAAVMFEGMYVDAFAAVANPTVPVDGGIRWVAPDLAVLHIRPPVPDDRVGSLGVVFEPAVIGREIAAVHVSLLRFP